MFHTGSLMELAKIYWTAGSVPLYIAKAHGGTVTVAMGAEMAIIPIIVQAMDFPSSLVTKYGYHAIT